MPNNIAQCQTRTSIDLLQIIINEPINNLIIFKDTIRSYALDHSADNYLAIGFASGRICIFPAEIDPSIKYYFYLYLIINGRIDLYAVKRFGKSKNALQIWSGISMIQIDFVPHMNGKK